MSTDPTEQNFPRLEVELAEHDGAKIVALSGELDLRGAAELQAVLDSASAGERPRVCLDLSELRFIDSTGLALVIRSHQHTTGVGGAYVVVCVDGTVRRTFETTGLMTMLSVAETVDEALDALGVDEI